MAAACATALVGQGAKAVTQTRKTFVLVHGAYHGGWCWRRVADLLEAQGHKVFTPTLTGLGERAHLLGRDTTLDVHIADLVGVFEWEDLREACLVVHSYGGWVGSGALEKIGDRVASAVWLDAFRPRDGERPMDASEAIRSAVEAALATGQAGLPPPPSALFLVNDKDQVWVDAKMTPQPVAALAKPIKLSGALSSVRKKTFVRTPRFGQTGLDEAYAESRADAGWRALENRTSGHDLMIDDPRYVAEVLQASA